MQSSLPTSYTIWKVGTLCNAIHQSLKIQFQGLVVEGEISGFSCSANGHCYFSLKDETGQLRCAMFRRVASALDKMPTNGDKVQIKASLSVYETRGDLQLVIEALEPIGQGPLFERFLQLKTKLEQEGLFDSSTKKNPTTIPKAIGLVTSPQAAALHDVLTTLARRSPHLPIVFASSSVQGMAAAKELCAALTSLYQYIQNPASKYTIDSILLVRGGGSLEDLWSFNEEALARLIKQSPVPIISGIGHETDFTIADFVADVRAPTPTAAAEIASIATEDLTYTCQSYQEKMSTATHNTLDKLAQKLDIYTSNLSTPAKIIHEHQLKLTQYTHRIQLQAQQMLSNQKNKLLSIEQSLTRAKQNHLQQLHTCLEHLTLRLHLLDPQLILERGYAWLESENGCAISSATQLTPQQKISARLVDGWVQLQVEQVQIKTAVNNLNNS